MCHARMVGLTRPDLFQDSRTFQLIGIGLVGRRSPDIERQSIVDLRFIVLWISSCKLLLTRSTMLPRIVSAAAVR